jgi:hypothetical protein
LGVEDPTRAIGGARIPISLSSKNHG